MAGEKWYDDEGWLKKWSKDQGWLERNGMMMRDGWRETV